jgi:hypothetical protein
MTKAITQRREPHTENWDILYRLVRSGFITKGTSLAAWCRANGVHRQSAERALLFRSDGPKAQALRSRIAEAAGVPWR